jgi:methyl-accepting chemotaxis protein
MANLIDPMNIKVNLKAVASTIKESDENAAQRLEELSLAVGGGTNADAWAASDIYQLIEPDNIIMRYKNQPITDRLQAWLEWIRNTLIFAPLVVTWLGVSQAIDKYNQFIQKDPTQSIQPFLLLWQEGFGNSLPPILKLSSLAFIDFVLLIAVLLLTVAVYTISNTIKQKRETEAEDLRCQLTHALSGAVLHLRTRNWQEPTNLLTRFDEASKQFEDTVAKLLDQILALADRQQQDLNAFADFKNDLSNSMIAMSSSALELKKTTTELHQSVTELITPAQTFATQHGALLASTQEAVTLFKNQIAAQDNIVEEQQKWGTELSSALETLKGTFDQGKNIAKEIEQFAKEQTGLVTAMKDEHHALAQLANNVYTATDSVKEVVREIDHCSNELRAINVYMNDLVRRIASMK